MDDTTNGHGERLLDALSRRELLRRAGCGAAGLALASLAEGTTAGLSPLQRLLPGVRTPLPAAWPPASD